MALNDTGDPDLTVAGPPSGYDARPTDATGPRLDAESGRARLFDAPDVAPAGCESRVEEHPETGVCA